MMMQLAARIYMIAWCPCRISNANRWLPSSRARICKTITLTVASVDVILAKSGVSSSPRLFPKHSTWKSVLLAAMCDGGVKAQGLNLRLVLTRVSIIFRTTYALGCRSKSSTIL